MATGPLFRFLDTVGDGSGTKNANADGSSTAVHFKLYCASGPVFAHRMLIQIADNAVLSADDYGGVTGPLTNGVTVDVRSVADNTSVVDLLDGVPIKESAGWSRVCYDVSLDDFGSGANFVKVRWTFAKSGSPIVLLPGQTYLDVAVQDDLTALVGHYFMVQGSQVL